MDHEAHPPPIRQRSLRGPSELGLRLLAAAGLVVDAVVHLLLAGDYDANPGSLLSEGALFRVEAVAAVGAALLVLLVRRVATDVVVLAVAASAAAAAILYRYVDIGSFAGLPAMYEPVWFAQKSLSVIGEIVAVLAVVVLLAARRSRGDAAARA